MTFPLTDPPPEGQLLPYLAQILFRTNWWTKEPGSNSSWHPDRTISNAAVVPYTALATTKSPQTGEPLTVMKSLFSAHHKARLSSFVLKITTDYQDKYVETVRSTDSSANVCAGCGTHFCWAGAQCAPLGETELYIFYSLLTSAFLLLTAVHLLLCRFFGSLFIDVEHACWFCQILSYNYCAAIVINSTV